jgi:hypothetical protein
VGFKLGLLTNVGSYDPVKLRYEREGLLDLFDVVVASQAFPWRKPSRKIFEAACCLLGVKPAEAVYVGGDAQLDIAGAKAAGLRAIQVLKYAREKSQLADVWIESIEDLPAAIERLSRPDSGLLSVSARECGPEVKDLKRSSNRFSRVKVERKGVGGAVQDLAREAGYRPRGEVRRGSGLGGRLRVRG